MGPLVVIPAKAGIQLAPAGAKKGRKLSPGRGPHFYLALRAAEFRLSPE
jgi:hypothetical protein